MYSQNITIIYLPTVLNDITSGVVSSRIISPCTGKLYEIKISPDAALATGPNTITVKINSTTVRTITIDTSFAANSTYSFICPTNNTLSENNIVEITTDGAGTGTVNVSILAVFNANV